MSVREAARTEKAGPLESNRTEHQETVLENSTLQHLLLSLHTKAGPTELKEFLGGHI